MVSYQRCNAAQFHRTANRRNVTRSKENKASCIVVSTLVSCSTHLPRRPALHSLAPHSLPRTKGDQGIPIFDGFFPQHHYYTEGKKSLPRMTARSEPGLGSFRDDHSNHPPYQPLPGQTIFPLPKLPVSYTAPISPRLTIPFITAHKTCVLPVISGCKREAKLQVGTCSVSSNWRGKR